MGSQRRWDGDRLVSELASALAPPDVPLGVLEAAKAVYTWRTVDAQLAALSYDSAVSGDALVGLRGTTAPPRTLAFEAPDLSLVAEVTEDALVGYVLPAEAGVLEVQEAPGVCRRVPVDSTGGFRVHPLPRAAFRLVYTGERGQRLVTDRVLP